MEEIIKAEKCRHFEECNAPICPIDEESIKSAIWYPDEEICRSNIHGGQS